MSIMKVDALQNGTHVASLWPVSVYFIFFFNVIHENLLCVFSAVRIIVVRTLSLYRISSDDCSFTFHSVDLAGSCR